VYYPAGFSSFLHTISCKLLSFDGIRNNSEGNANFDQESGNLCV